MKSFGINLLLFLLLFIGCPSENNAQQYPITNYTRDRGLPGNQVWGIYQDKLGYMWFCTSAGLIKYNGKEYKFLGKKDKLLDNIPIGITGDTKGNLWIAYDNGISRINELNTKNWHLKDSEGHFSIFCDSYERAWIHSLFFPGDVFYCVNDSLINFSQKYNFKNQVIVNITEDRQGGIIFITRQGKIYRFFANQIKEYVIDELESMEVRFSFFDSEDNFIICSEKGLGIVAGNQLNKNPKIKWLINTTMNFGMQSKTGYYWFASEKGIYRLKTLDDTRNEEVHITENNGLMSNIIYRLFEDYEGNVWIGYSEKGISKISSLIFSRFGKTDGLISDAIFSVTNVYDYQLVAADKGLFKFDGKKFELVAPSSKFSKRWYFSVLPYKEDEVLLGSTPGIIGLYDNANYRLLGLNRKIVQTMLKDNIGNVWIGTSTGLYLKNGNEFIEQDYSVKGFEIKKLLEVKKKDLYIGTNNGLVIVENGTVPFTKKNIVTHDKSGFPIQAINDIISDDEGEIIVTGETGLLVFNKQKKIEQVKDLMNVEIIALHLDNNKRLWAGSNSFGLYVLQKNNGKYEVTSHYTYRDGISSDEFAYNNAICQTPDGKIAFGMFGGLTVYDPKEERIINRKPRTYITGVKVNDSTYTSDDITDTELSSSQNKISFSCVALSFYNEDEIKFQYYLSGIEKEWTNTSRNPEITYGYLESGEYTFYMRAVNQFGITSEPQFITFNILAPFWKRPWFIILFVAFIGFTAYQGYIYRLRQVGKRNLQLEQIVKEKTKDLEASRTEIGLQYGYLVEAQKELVQKKELEKANKEIQLLKDRLEKENIYLRERQGDVQEVSSIIGRSPAITEIRKKIMQIAPTNTTVLITGETGVGKNLIAEAIHNSSLRKDRAHITVNCAAIPEALVESELFGHEKGAFTGAEKPRVGKFEVADGSTIFLDEIGDMNLTVQAKVLNVIQARNLTRIGSNNLINVDVRIIAATNHDLAKLVKEGKFRQDLYYRINVYPIYVAPLRQCTEDIESLAKYFIDRYSKLLNKKINAITKSALDILRHHNYPGNVRELENIIHRSVITTRNDVISDEDILLQISTNSTLKRGTDLHNDFGTLEEMEKQHIINVLIKTSGKISGKDGAAEILDINPSTLRSRMKKIGITFSDKD